ncbi:serine-rich adhesin for platelets isoform X1 [Rhagoletis pomonella]|uniref:serine-rich adhesin for platelets isoform X1 n=1 Tax=Rhagoletis pomonella TaxID=28610 RepID=UPI001782E651|nr:serine-rich adhesin for platelets isoform X1 [Rhagoletis pomonella]
MSVINYKEDSIKANILMEEGDSSLEPGEVKTPPHGNETTKPKGAEEAVKVKCTASHFLPRAKSASKQETDRCAEKVRAILELDAIKRKEELERKKEQKSDSSLQKVTTKKKEHKKLKIPKADAKNADLEDYKSEKVKKAVTKKPKRKRSKHEELESYPKHHAAESCESMRPIGSATSLPIIPSTSFVTPVSNFSRRFSDLNNPAPFRSYNPFMRNYRTDFRHRGGHFATHNRTRFSRYRSQYVSGSFHAPAEEPSHSQPPNSGIPYSELMWTKTKPSISYAFNLLDRVPTKKKRNSSDQNVQKKKKTKKSKERESSNKSLSSTKSSRKSSKRKKIRKIRETLPLHPTKKQLLSPNKELLTSTADDEGNTPQNENNQPESPICTIKKEESPEPFTNNVTALDILKTIKQEPIKEDSKLVDKADDLGKPEVLDMFASLTPPKQRSPSVDSKGALSNPTNVQITHKFQEIQDRIDKLLEDDDELKLEAIQATKDKLLQKSREHTENVHMAKSSKKIKNSTTKDKKNVQNILESRDTAPDRIVKQRSKDRDTSPSKPFDDAKRKEKTPIDIFSDNKKDERKHKKDERESSTPMKTAHSKILHKYSPSLKHQKKGNTLNAKKCSSKYKEFTSKKSSLEDSPSNLTKSALRTLDGSPDTDDYSDNWENDDEEIDINSAFQNVNHLEMSKNVTGCSPSSSVADSENSESSSKIQSTTPKNSPPRQCLSPKISYTPRESPKANDDSEDTNELQRLYNQFIKSVEGADIKPTEESNGVALIEVKKEIDREQLSTSSASNSSSSSSSSDTSISSSGSSSSTSSSDSASDDSNDTDTLKKEDVHSTSSTENAIETNVSGTSADKHKMHFLHTNDDSKPNVAKDLKKLENLEANLLRIQMMRANYDSADEISDELLKMEKLFLHEKNIILNKFKDSSMSKTTTKESETQNEWEAPMQTSIESFQSVSLSKGQFVQSLQKLQNKDDKSQASNIFDTNREVIKLTISPVKLPKTSAIFEADNDMEIAKQAMETSEKSNSAVKPPKPVKEVAIVKPIMESKEPPSGHHQKRRRSPMPSHHSLQSRSRTRRGRVRSLSVSPQRNGSARCTTPQRRGAFSKQSRNRNFERRSRSRSPSVTRPLSRRSGDISPVPRKRRSLLNMDDRFRKHSPRRDSRSRSRSRSPSSPPPRHRCDRYSRSPLPFKPPSPPTDPTSSPSDSRRSSLSPARRSRSISRSPRKRTVSPPSKSYESNRHRSLSPKHQAYKPHSPRQSNTSYYFNNSPSRISLDARINIVLNGPSSSHNENNNSIATYEDYNNYGQYGPAAYMSLPSDSNSFYTNQYVPMANAGGTVQPTHAIQSTYSNLPAGANDQTELFSAVSHQANVNASNFYYNRFGSQTFGLNAPSPLLKELPKATVAVQKGNVLEIVPCSDLLTDSVAEHTNENKKVSSNQQVMDEATGSNSEQGKRSILKSLDGETNSSRSAFVGAPKKKKVNFEDGVFPNHNSDDEDRKVVEAKIRVKMRRLRKKLGITPPCHNLFKDKARMAKQKAKSDKKTPPPPPPSGLAPPNLEQPIYLRTHTPTPLLYFHFDGVVHSMYVSQMERPIPPRLLNPKCLSTTNMSVVSQHTEAQSPLYMQSPISAGATHLHTNKKDPISSFTRPNRNENISPKVIPSTLPTLIQQATGSPKINFKLYSPIENVHHTEIGSATLPSTSPNSIKGSAIHTISSTTIGNHFLPKRQESPKDVVGTRANISMGLLPTPMSHPPVATQSTGVTTHTRIPVIGVPPTVIPNVVPSVSEPFMGGGFASTMMQNTHHPINNLNQNYMVPPPIAHINNPHMTGGVQQYFNSPVQRMHRPLPNYMVQQPQQSPTPSNLPMCHLVDPMEAVNADLDKFANPQAMAIPYNFKGP